MVVRRYGACERITMSELGAVSSQAEARREDWNPSCESKAARKRRKTWEKELFRKRTDVMSGTLESACELNRNQ